MPLNNIKLILLIILSYNTHEVLSTTNSFVSSFLDENADLSCLSISKHDSCVKTVDTNGINCRWCKSAKLGWLTACLSEYDEVMLPHGIAHCNSNSKSNEKEKSSIPDLTCFAYAKSESCNTAVDSVGNLCTWCQSPTLPFLKVCMTHQEMAALPAGVFECGDNNNNDSKKNSKILDTACLQHTDYESCASSVDISGWQCAWCKCDTLSWLSTCVSQKEAIQFPNNMYNCQHNVDRQKERENYIK